MATLQSALEVPGLRGVTLKAYSSFIESLKFNEIGPFIGSTSATFVRLWPEFTPMERQTATATLNYIIVDNAEDFSRFVQDVADLSGITELNTANRRLLAMRKTWSFEKRSTYLLARIESETDVVVLQALKELKTLMVGTVPQLQAFSAGDSFNESVGRLIKVLFSAAVKDGVDNVQIRGTAFECIGILGALDPDRFEVPPGESPTIVLENFTSHDESINFALHLIQHLLIGAYRSTNDTKHQECLAFAIQELLAFCGFTVDLVLATASTAKPVDSTTRERWNQLPKSVLETCGPLLGGSFQMQEKTSPVAAVYPIYSSTHSYREWIRIWAADLISKVEGASVKRIFSAFPPVLRLEDIAVAQHLLPHLVLNALISGSDDDRAHVKTEMETVLQDQVSPTRQLSDNSRLLTAQVSSLPSPRTLPSLKTMPADRLRPHGSSESLDHPRSQVPSRRPRQEAHVQGRRPHRDGGRQVLRHHPSRGDPPRHPSRPGRPSCAHLQGLRSIAPQLRVPHRRPALLQERRQPPRVLREPARVLCRSGRAGRYGGNLDQDCRPERAPPDPRAREYGTLDVGTELLGGQAAAEAGGACEPPRTPSLPSQFGALR
jgi:hypothetical protein